jgi:hypothetical protein
VRLTLKAIAVAVVAMSIVGGGAAGAARLITGKQIRDSSITGWDIKNHSLKPVDFKGSVRGPRGQQGAEGARGAQGQQGVQGPQGPAGPTVVNQLTRVELVGVIPPGTVNHVTASCPAGQGVVSGGYYAVGKGAVFYEDSFGGRAWAVGYDNLGAGVQADVTAVAYCAPAGQAVASRSSLTQAATRLDDAIARQRALHERRSR